MNKYKDHESVGLRLHDCHQVHIYPQVPLLVQGVVALAEVVPPYRLESLGHLLHDLLALLHVSHEPVGPPVE